MAELVVSPSADTDIPFSGRGTMITALPRGLDGGGGSCDGSGGGGMAGCVVSLSIIREVLVDSMG